MGGLVRRVAALYHDMAPPASHPPILPCHQYLKSHRNIQALDAHPQPALTPLDSATLGDAWGPRTSPHRTRDLNAKKEA